MALALQRRPSKRAFHPFCRQEQSHDPQSEGEPGVQIHPQKNKRKSPPKELRIILGTLQNQQPQTSQKQRYDLRTHSPDRRSGPGGEKRGEAGNVWSGAAAQIKQKERRTQDPRENYNQSSPPCDALNLI